MRTKARKKPSDITEAIMIPIAVADIPCIVWVQSLGSAAEEVTFPNDDAGKLVGAFIDQLILCSFHFQYSNNASRKWRTLNLKCTAVRMLSAARTQRRAATEAIE